LCPLSHVYDSPRNLHSFPTRRSSDLLVLQKNHIFNGTIEENIRYGNINATEEEIIEAAKKAYIHDQIMMLPEQYKSKALNLSGRSEEHTSELQSRENLVCRLLLEKKE